MTTEPGNLLYKCRLCGQVQKYPHVLEGQLALLVLLGLAPAPEWWIGLPVPGVLVMHYCGDGRRGIADLIGFEEDVK